MYILSEALIRFIMQEKKNDTVKNAGKGTKHCMTVKSITHNAQCPLMCILSSLLFGIKRPVHFSAETESFLTSPREEVLSRRPRTD